MKKLLSVIMTAVMLIGITPTAIPQANEPYKLTELVLNSQNIPLLHYYTDLEKVYLNPGSYSDFSDDEIMQISLVPKLKELRMFVPIQISAHWPYRDITPFGSLTNLEVLSFRNIRVTDISALSNLVNLEVLILNDARVTDVSALSGLTKLKYLDLSSH